MSKQYDILYIQQYLEGKLSAREMHTLERDALEDDMLQDAIEGFRLSNVNHRQLSLLQQRLEERVEAHHAEKNRFYFTGQRLAIASVAGVMMIVVGVLFWMMNTQRNESQAAKNEQSEVVVHLQNKVHVTLLSGSAIPKEGWNSYQDYLSVNGSQIAVGEEIHLSFEVIKSRPQNIEVLSSDSSEAATKLIELLQKGPSWNGEAGEILINF